MATPASLSAEMLLPTPGAALCPLPLSPSKTLHGKPPVPRPLRKDAFYAVPSSGGVSSLKSPGSSRRNSQERLCGGSPETPARGRKVPADWPPAGVSVLQPVDEDKSLRAGCLFERRSHNGDLAASSTAVEAVRPPGPPRLARTSAPAPASTPILQRSNRATPRAPCKSPAVASPSPSMRVVKRLFDASAAGGMMAPSAGGDAAGGAARARRASQQPGLSILEAAADVQAESAAMRGGAAGPVSCPVRAPRVGSVGGRVQCHAAPSAAAAARAEAAAACVDAPWVIGGRFAQPLRRNASPQSPTRCTPAAAPTPHGSAGAAARRALAADGSAPSSPNSRATPPACASGKQRAGAVAAAGSPAAAPTPMARIASLTKMLEAAADESDAAAPSPSPRRSGGDDAARGQKGSEGGARPRRAAALAHRFFNTRALSAHAIARAATGMSPLGLEDDTHTGLRSVREQAVSAGGAKPPKASKKLAAQVKAIANSALGLVYKRPRRDKAAAEPSRSVSRRRSAAREDVAAAADAGAGGGGDGSDSEDGIIAGEEGSVFVSRGAGRSFAGNAGSASFLGSFYGPASAEPRSP